MSSDFYPFGTSNIHTQTHSTSDMVSSSDDGVGDLLFFSDSFPFFSDIPQENSNNTNQHQFDETIPSSLDPFSPSFFSFSPPTTNLENLTLYRQPNHVLNAPTLENEFGSFSSALDGFEVKSEECQLGIDYNINTYNQHHFFPHSYSGAENVSKYMQRSFSSNSFDGKPGFLFKSHCDRLIDSPNFQRHAINSPENSSLDGQMRRVCSTGDLQNMKANNISQTEEEPNLKVGRYSAEERKERISKYRAKRSQRNFNRTIKYACRKTLADNRPRIRGRFARNDEAIDIPKVQCTTRYEEEVDFWIEELHEEQENVTMGAEEYVNNFGASQFQYCGF
ncbi:PREDICTED: putative zinc finger protein CONSTANS-LIKE 11 [Lupinus angustifolius]|nr:PREDICTED: putative zinc finger protein CONSTANS-LIKE 11 [Lupinus angustifolius]